MLLRRYVHGPGVDAPIVWYEGAGTADRRWLHGDERGSIVAESNLGTGTTAYSYGPYGEPGGGPAAGVPASRFRYTGQILLPELGLYHYRARAYSPRLGRFLQTDPIGYADGPNLYAYVLNDPVNAKDPSGMACVAVGNDGCSTIDPDPEIIVIAPELPEISIDVDFGPDSWTLASAYRAIGAWRTGNPPGSRYPYRERADRSGREGAQGEGEQFAWSENEKWILRNGSYVLNPTYVDPTPWLNLQNAIIIPPLIGTAAAVLPEIVVVARYGKEIAGASRNWRIAPFGNRTGHPTGRFPHYHRRPSGSVPPGQGIGRHRPWDSSPFDNSFPVYPLDACST